MTMHLKQGINIKGLDKDFGVKDLNKQMLHLNIASFCLCKVPLPQYPLHNSLKWFEIILKLFEMVRSCVSGIIHISLTRLCLEGFLLSILKGG